MSYNYKKSIFASRLVAIATMTCLVSLLVSYLFQVEKVIKGGYSIREYSQEISKLLEESKEIKIKAVAHTSLKNLEKKIEALNFVNVSEVKYIPVPFEYLAQGGR